MRLLKVFSYYWLGGIIGIIIIIRRNEEDED
jgi:hypothetical protein